MGLFSKKEAAPSAEELAAREENKKLLERFNVTKSWGVKKYPTAMQFIYDEEMRAFVVVEGPDETFKSRNPWVVGFDEVEDVWLEVDEWWTEDGNQFNKQHNYKVLLQEDYRKVFWHYDLYCNIKTKHPYAGTIRFQLNFKTNILLIPAFTLFVHRGLELNGDYHGSAIQEQSDRLTEFSEKIKGNVKKEKIFDILTLQRSDSILENMKEDLTDEWYITRIDNVNAHVKRAARIAKLLGCC